MNHLSKAVRRVSGLVVAAVLLAGGIRVNAEGLHLQWLYEGGKAYWYENGVRQGTYSDPHGVLGDGTVRGREIYDPVSNGWYWLDSVYNGAKAINKEVWIPYIYQEEAGWGNEEIMNNSAASGTMSGQVESAIRGGYGKWVRYDSNGAMAKEWYRVTGDQVFYYPDQVGNIYYYDWKTGLMAKGNTQINGETYHFNEVTGVWDNMMDAITVDGSNLPAKAVNAMDFGAIPNDSIDDGERINDAIKAVLADPTKDTVYVPAGNYIINTYPGIAMVGCTGINLIMDPNAVLDVQGNNLTNYNVITLMNSSKINIVGGQIRGERYKHTGTGGEWGMGIGMYGCSDVTISYCDVRANWGDGIYIGYNSAGIGCDKVTLRHCIVADNRRTNISIVQGNNVIIDHCNIQVTNSAGSIAPRAGINIEPDTTGGITPTLTGIRIWNTTVTSPVAGERMGQFMCFRNQDYRAVSPSTVSCKDVELANCMFQGDIGNYSGENFRVINTTVTGTFYCKNSTILNNVKANTYLLGWY